MSDQDAKERLAKALIDAQAVGTAPPNPYVLNQSMEQAAQPNSPPIHPLVNAIMQRMGLLNFIRNRRNAGVVDPEGPPPP